MGTYLIVITQQKQKCNELLCILSPLQRPVQQGKISHLPKFKLQKFGTLGVLPRTCSAEHASGFLQFCSAQCSVYFYYFQQIYVYSHCGEIINSFAVTDCKAPPDINAHTQQEYMDAAIIIGQYSWRSETDKKPMVDLIYKVVYAQKNQMTGSQGEIIHDLQWLYVDL